jgi:hypothetical protein
MRIEFVFPSENAVVLEWHILSCHHPSLNVMGSGHVTDLKPPALVENNES